MQIIFFLQICKEEMIKENNIFSMYLDRWVKKNNILDDKISHKMKTNICGEKNVCN